MKKFYKIENGQLQVGTGTQAPDGFIEFEEGKEPEELLDAIEVERLEQELQNKIKEAKNFLSLTDFKMTIDYFATMTKEEQNTLVSKRAEARLLINKLGRN